MGNLDSSDERGLETDLVRIFWLLIGIGILALGYDMVIIFKHRVDMNEHAPFIISLTVFILAGMARVMKNSLKKRQ